jgi:hypothetical protein
MRVGDGSSSHFHVMKYTSGTITFVNNGNRAEYSEAKSLTNGFEAVLLERPVKCDQGGKFRVHVRCQGDLTKAGPFRLALPFIDKLGNSGWSEAILDHFLERVTVKNHRGQPRPCGQYLGDFRKTGNLLHDSEPLEHAPCIATP